MNRMCVALLLSGAIGLVASGCASTGPEFRGQSPGGWSSGPAMVHGCPSCQSASGPGGQMIHSPECQHAGHGAACQNGNCNLPFVPVHRSFHTYSAPEGLMYPPQNQPPGLYQYPYYTLRGPTDFFMK